jgi:ABC-type lipoprotein release transport system permease subunit
MPESLVVGTLGPGRLLRLAARNLLRNRRRTLLTTVTAGLAVFLLLLMTSLLNGIERQSFDNLIHFQTAHAKIFEAGWFELREELPLEHSLENVEQLLTRAEMIPGVAAAVPRVSFMAYLSDGRDQIPVRGVGIETSASDDRVFRIRQAIVEGDYLEPGSEGLLLGSGLATLFDVAPGDWLTVLVRSRIGVWEALELPVTGILGTGNPLIDQNSFLMPLEDARRMLDMQGRATEIAIRLSPRASERRALKRLKEIFDPQEGLLVAGWREQEADFIALAEAKRSGSAVMLGIFVLLALVGIANTMLMAAFERVREVGMLMAMGMRPASIRRLFWAEGALAGLAGGTFGLLLAAVPILYLSGVGIDFAALYGDMDIGYPVREAVYPSLSAASALLACLGTSILAALATLYPAARASRLNPAAALRHV